MQRYSRQIVLPEIGIEGQKRLRQAHVLCIGAGGLGCPALQYLVGAGIGHITIIDDDDVDISNLQRQVLFDETQVGQNKALAAKEALVALNSEIQIEALPERFCGHNAQALLANVDVVIDGTDNFASKFLINDACVKFQKPLIYASILGFEAQVSVFDALHGPCYRCLFPAPPSGHVPNCAEAGVLGAMAGIAGCVQALEAIKVCLGYAFCNQVGLEPLLGKVWLLNARNMSTRTLILPKNQACDVCSQDTSNLILHENMHSCTRAKLQSLDAEQLPLWQSQATLVDVRDVHELELGMIEGAIHIPLAQLLNEPNALDLIAPTQAVLVYCQLGVRSKIAAEFLLQNGFENVAHLTGGFEAIRSSTKS